VKLPAIRLLAACGLLALSGSAAARQSRSADGSGLATFDAAWRIVNETHFDPAFNGVNWQAVREELRPRAASARGADELRAVVREMLGRLGQSHFVLLPTGAGDARATPADLSGQVGFEVRLSGGEILVTHVAPEGPAAAAGVKAGWIVRAVGGEAMASLLQGVAGDLPDRLRRVEAWRAVSSRLRGPAGSSVGVQFVDGAGGIVELTLQREPEPGAPVKVGSLPTLFVRVHSRRLATPGGRQAGHIVFNVWMPAVDREVQTAVDRFRDATGIVLDVRGNPGGLASMLMGISGHFLRERVALGTMTTRENTLRFVANPRLVSAAGVPVEPYDGPLAILVDAMSGSASECFAGGMQSLGRARIFGQATMGQALPSVFDRLPNGDVLIHAYGDFVTATGIRLEGRGVLPDEPIPLLRADLLAGRDAALAAALTWVDEVAAARARNREAARSGTSRPW
jgi:carboxyl-terminal processing protease